MKLVCDVLGVARSNVQVRVRRPADWMDRRRHRRPRDDGELVTEITNEIAALPSYGYRRAWEMVNRQRDRVRRQRGQPQARLSRHAREPAVASAAHRTTGRHA